MNPIPSDPVDLKVMSGLRFGVSGATTRGLGVADFETIGDLISEVLEGLRESPGDNSAIEASVAARVGEIAARFTTYG
jgi:glycine hydroxymethyltransferase